jgi:hypothetical protein
MIVAFMRSAFRAVLMVRIAVVSFALILVISLAVCSSVSTTRIPAIAWHRSGAVVIEFAVPGGGDQVFVSFLSPFYVGQLIRIDSEPMLVVGEGVSFGYGDLVVQRWHRSTHVVLVPIWIGD